MALSTCSQISQANPFLSMQISAASPRSAAETGATHAPGDQTLAAGKPSTWLPCAMVRAAVHPPRPVLPSPAGRQGSARCAFISGMQRSPPGRHALSHLVALLPSRACRALQAHPDPTNLPRLPNVLPDVENGRGFPNGSAGEVRASCLYALGSGRALTTHRASVPHLATPAAVPETGIKAPAGVGADRVAQRCGRGRGQLKIHPETQRSSLKARSETLHLVGLLTGPVAVGLARMGKRWSCLLCGGGRKKISLMSWCWDVKRPCVGCGVVSVLWAWGCTGT